MKKEAIIQATEAVVKQMLEKEATGHDWWHIVRVRNNARLINNTECADAFIIDLALLLHDVGDRKVINKKDDDYSIAENILKEQNLSAIIIDQVMFIIKNMSFSKSLNNKNDKAPPEFYIVQDADRLDAIGAIGIARAFAYGGSKGRLLYDPTKKPLKFDTTQNYQQSESSTLHHFDEKLLLLKNLMNTKSAKAIAKKRHTYMKKYLQQFHAEWGGER